MNTEQLETLLKEAIIHYFDIKSCYDDIKSCYGPLDTDEDDYDVLANKEVDVATFADRGVMTYNKGLVITIGSDEFQVSIVRSR